MKNDRRNNKRPGNRIYLLGALAVVFLPFLPPARWPSVPPPVFVVNTVPASATRPVFQKEDVALADDRSPMLHSSAITEMKDGRLLVAWYGGTRESSADVEIYGSYLENGSWSKPVSLMSPYRAEHELARSIFKLGNPVLFTDESGRTWMFFGTVTGGGWSTSDINFTFSDNNGVTWGPAGHLVAAPHTHSGTLVKGAPVEFEDGTIGLPVYRGYGVHSFSELLRVDHLGRIVAMYDMAHAACCGLQPTVAVVDKTNAVSFQRYFGDQPKRILRSTTSDGGMTWTPAVKTDLRNPDAAIASLELSDGRLIIVYNDSEERRDNLLLAISADRGISWNTIIRLEAAIADQGPLSEFSYPQMLRDREGMIHLVYSVDRNRIRHASFNEAWLNSFK